MVTPSVQCADCGKQIHHTKLPQGQARCHTCRQAKPGGRTCAGCGISIWGGGGARPQDAMCRPCRNAAVEQSPKPERQYDYRKACRDCGGPSYGIRCRTCRDLRQRVRSSDHPDVRRSQREQAAPGLPNRVRRELLAKWKRQGRTCAYCSSPPTTIDHVLPLVRGGTNYEGNLVPCCKRCNSSKAGWTVIEWRTGKRLTPMTSALPWSHAPAPKIKAIRGVEVGFKTCPVCQALHVERPAFCSSECAAEHKRQQDRDRLRALNAIRPERWRTIVNPTAA